jgi:mycothiol synthase
MHLSHRPYQSDNDYWRIRQFLRHVFCLNDRIDRAWSLPRFDYWRWHGYGNVEDMPPLEQIIHLWETNRGEIAAVLLPEGSGEAHLQIHPEYETPGLVEEMLDTAELWLADISDAGRKLITFAKEDDQLRQALLQARGYTRGSWPEYQRRRSLETHLPEGKLVTGYTIRPLGDVDEHPARSWVSWRAFHPGEPDEKYEGWAWYANVQRCPLYRRDLDIVAVAPDGVIAAFCTAWFDDVNRIGVFEPVGVMPEHHRRGLGRAVMVEGMQRLAYLGATRAFVGSYSPAAHALYESMGFTEYHTESNWWKCLE